MGRLDEGVLLRTGRSSKTRGTGGRRWRGRGGPPQLKGHVLHPAAVDALDAQALGGSRGLGGDREGRVVCRLAGAGGSKSPGRAGGPSSKAAGWGTPAAAAGQKKQKNQSEEPEAVGFRGASPGFDPRTTGRRKTARRGGGQGPVHDDARLPIHPFSIGAKKFGQAGTPLPVARRGAVERRAAIWVEGKPWMRPCGPSGHGRGGCPNLPAKRATFGDRLNLPGWLRPRSGTGASRGGRRLPGLHADKVRRAKRGVLDRPGSEGGRKLERSGEVGPSLRRPGTRVDATSPARPPPVPAERRPGAISEAPGSHRDNQCFARGWLPHAVRPPKVRAGARSGGRRSSGRRDVRPRAGGPGTAVNLGPLGGL